jgi:hypothetical protein
MKRRTTLTITMALGLALAGGVGTARAASATTGQAVSTIRAVDPEQGMVVLNDGTHLVVSDPAVLAALHEGEIVRVQYTQDAGRYVVNRVEQVDREPSPYDQMHVGEGETTGARTAPSIVTDGTYSASPSSRTEADYGGGPEPQAP